MAMVRMALLYARTLIRLRPRQLAFLVVRRLQARLPRVPASPVTELPPESMERLGPVVREWAWSRDREAVARATDILADRFVFLNHTETLPSIDWTRRYVSHLWSYHLHYFDYAVDLALAHVATGDHRYRAKLEALMLSWIRQTRDGRGDGWEPYAVSMRIVHWSYALLIAGPRIDPETRTAITASLGSQARYLARRLEWHVDGNHLQKNYHALATAGLVLAGDEAADWWEEGSAGMWRCLLEQTAPDGGHLERTPLYHLQALADYLQLLELMAAVGRRPPAAVEERARRMIAALGTLSRSDGTLHLFADTSGGHGPTVTAAERAAVAVLDRGIDRTAGLLSLPETGYRGVWWPDDGVRLLVDCGDFGASYQPGHGHCDLLSFELDIFGRPVIVDSGVSGYADDPLREYCRSTRAHNTVSVAGREQSEIWGSFRVARRAQVRHAEHAVGDRGYDLSAACSPYHDRRTVHERHLELGRDGTLRVRDRVRGSAGAPLQSFVHFAPDLDVRIEAGGVHIAGLDFTLMLEAVGVDQIRMVRGQRHPLQGWHCPKFGVRLPAPVVELVVTSNTGAPFGFDLHPI